MFVMMTGCVIFELGTEFLDITKTSFGYKGLMISITDYQ